MKEDILKEFISYAKEQFGVDITVSKETEADSFEKLFGGTSLNDSAPIDYITDKVNYEMNFQTGLTVKQDAVFICDDTVKLEVAA